MMNIWLPLDLSENNEHFLTKIRPECFLVFLERRPPGGEHWDYWDQVTIGLHGHQSVTGNRSSAGVMAYQRDIRLLRGHQQPSS